MTVLGWAVYFGGKNLEECKDIIKHASNQETCDPFILMRDGFFRGKTVKEIAEYYARKEIVLLLEKLESSFEHKLQGGERRRLSTVPARFREGSSKGFIGVSSSSLKSLKSFSSSSTKKKEDSEEYKQMLAHLISVGVLDPNEQTEACFILLSSEFCTVELLRVVTDSEKLTSLGMSLSTAMKLTHREDSYILEPVEKGVMEVQRESVDLNATFSEPQSSSSLLETLQSMQHVEVEAELERVPSYDEEEEEFHSRIRRLGADKNVHDSLANFWKPLPLGKHYHFYLSYNKGKNQQNKWTVLSLKNRLHGKGYLVWIDEDQFEDDHENDIKKGLEQSCIFVACLTKVYQLQVSRPDFIWTGVEFNLAKNSGMKMVEIQLERTTELNLSRSFPNDEAGLLALCELI